MDKVKLCFETLSEKDLTQEHPWKWPAAAKLGEADCVGTESAIGSFYVTCGLINWQSH
jgi:hypothetical protein